jgi:hypothetical protein
MYCPSCGNEITVELKYCNRCGANLSLPYPSLPAQVVAPVRLIAPSIVLGLTITGGLGIIFGGASEFVRMGLHPAAITWIVLFSLATLFGCTALLLRFWSKMFALQREHAAPQPAIRPRVERSVPQQQLPPRLEPVPSVTEHTTRTFAPMDREGLDRGSR